MTETFEEYISKIKQLKIMVVEDDPTSQLIIRKRLNRDFKTAKIKTGSDPLDIYPELYWMEKPDVIIMDWSYKNYDCSSVLQRLSTFSGLVCFFSNHDALTIRNKILKKMEIIPNNFKIFNKFNYNGLSNEISKRFANNIQL
ncbi:MAG: response regulator [Psychroserpens sp.]|nr:response regulator [Psychroserpens sp.]